jgi:arginine N-succinyltransferase
MHLVRPCTLEDVSGIESLVRDNHARVSSLPRKRARLAERIEQSVRSFEQGLKTAGSEFFLFVLEDTNTGELLGCSGIAMNRDPKRPFYNYRLGELVHASERYDIHTAVSVLHLTHDLSGHTVLCSFAVKPNLLGSPLFHLISRARLMFIRQYEALFSEKIVVEMQGVYGDEGGSAFWDSLGRNFFDMDFASAEYHVATKSRTLLAELMPPHPIYVSLLSPAAQAIIGGCDDTAKDVYRLLSDEGFESSPYIDIFDGGAVLIGRKSELRTCVSAARKTVRAGKVSTGTHHMLSNATFKDFKCGLVQSTDGHGGVVRIDSSALDLLAIKEGDEVFHAAL